MTFKVDRSVIGGESANGAIALSIPAAEDIPVTFEIVTSERKEIFVKPDPVIIMKGATSQTVLIKTTKTEKNANALITATARNSQPFELDCKLSAVPPSISVARRPRKR